MIGLLAAALGKEPRMEVQPMQPGDVPATYADIGQIRTKLGFEPSTPIFEGIPRLVDWYMDFHHLESTQAKEQQ